MTPTPPNLAASLKTSLTGFVGQTVRQVVEVDKTVWNARVRRNELYYRGYPNLIYQNTPSGLVDYQSIGSGAQASMGVLANNGGGLYDYFLPFFQGDVDTFIAVIGARAPNGQAQARDLSNEQQVRMKLKADRVNAYLDSHWDVPLLHQQLVRGIALYGTMFGYTRYAVNPRKYGTTPVQKFEQQLVPEEPPYYHCPNCGAETEMMQAQSLGQGNPACQQCGIPLGPESLVEPDSIISLVPTEIIPYANGAVECSILNPAHVTMPCFVPNEGYAPWGIYETEDDKGGVIQAYPELRDKAYQETYAVGMDAASAMGRYTRELLTSVAGVQQVRTKARWLHTRLWITPASYEYLPADRSGDLREFLLQKYPDGLMAPMVNGEVLCGGIKCTAYPQGSPSRIINERMTSVLVACKPKPSEMIYADAYFECMIQGSDTINDCASMLIEQAERSNPFVIADPEILDPDMLRQYSSIPGEFKFAKPGSVGSLDKGFFRVPAAELNPVLIQFIDKVIGWYREATGIQPSLFGGDSGGGEKTAREVEIRRNQAMAKLNVPWSNLRQFWAQMRENGIYQAAKYSDGKLVSSSRQGTLENMQVDGIWDLTQGGWFIETEESTPETIGQRRDWINNTLTLSPEVQQQVFGMGDPGNIEKIQEANGMSDWVIPGYRQVQRIKAILARLSTAQVIQQPPPPMPPQDPMLPPQPPPPPPPSIQFEARLLDPQLTLKAVQDYLLDSSRQDMETTNPNGYQNIMAYLDQVHAAMPPPPSPMKWSGTIDFSTLTPPAQQAVAQMEGINVPGLPPGMPLAMPKPPSLGPAGPHGPPARGGPQPPSNPEQPPNPMAEPAPQGMLPPPDQSSQPPLPPGVLQ